MADCDILERRIKASDFASQKKCFLSVKVFVCMYIYKYKNYLLLFDRLLDVFISAKSNIIRSWWIIAIYYLLP